MANLQVVDADQLEDGLTVVANAIRAKGDTTDNLAFPDGMTAAIGAIETSVVDYLRFASTMTFANLNLFKNSKIEIILDESTRIGGMFSQSAKKNTTVEEIVLIAKKPVELANAVFYAASGEDDVLRKIVFNVDISNATNFATVFYRLRGLKTIEGYPLDFSSITNCTNAFGFCNSLQEVRFVPSTIRVSISFNASPLLSGETVQSIIDGLADLTGGTAQTLTLHADVKAKLTELQIATITGKNWTLA